MARSGGLNNKMNTRRVHSIITHSQIELACKHLTEMVKIGVREDIAGRTLDVFVDVYAKMFHGGTSSTHTPAQVHNDYWSDAAKALVASGTTLQRGDIQVEHGTPRRRLSELILTTYQKGSLSAVELDRIVDERWMVAVVTREEHRRLENEELPDSPEARWAAADIRFSRLDHPARTVRN